MELANYYFTKWLGWLHNLFNNPLGAEDAITGMILARHDMVKELYELKNLILAMEMPKDNALDANPKQPASESTGGANP